MSTLAQPQNSLKPTTQVYTPVITGTEEGGMLIPPRLPAMNVDAVKIDGGHWDRGAFHRAVAIARQLCSDGIWNGQDIITIFDPYVTHAKVFGVSGQPLKAGVDYLIVAPVIPHSTRRELPVTEDGDILWA